MSACEQNETTIELNNRPGSAHGGEMRQVEMPDYGPADQDQIQHTAAWLQRSDSDLRVTLHQVCILGIDCD